MSHRHLLVLALIAGLPEIAGAQFTTFIPPQNRVADSAKAVVVAQQKAKADSVVNLQITNMKTWVDSAAGSLPAVPATAPDSQAPAITKPTTVPATVPATVPTTAPTTTVPDSAVKSAGMRNGERAPATASALPLFALLGAIGVAIGVFLLVSARSSNPRPGDPGPARVRP
jgi:hypothetical protein